MTWIKSEEQLPDYDIEVLIYLRPLRGIFGRESRIMVGYMSHDDEWVAEQCIQPHDAVTYWRPIPEKIDEMD